MRQIFTFTNFKAVAPGKEGYNRFEVNEQKEISWSFPGPTLLIVAIYIIREVCRNIHTITITFNP